MRPDIAHYLTLRANPVSDQRRRIFMKPAATVIIVPEWRSS